jgi:LmbE family N-acetylglucosaminyl deacetylase
METRILMNADWVLTPTKGCRAQLARDLSVYPTPRHWRVVPHARPMLRHYDRREARDRLGWEEQSCYIIAVGRHAPLKQFPALIRACAGLSVNRVRLVIVGDGDTEALQHLAEEVGIGERIQFAATDDMGLYYSAADVYVSTSMTESFGLANLEALAAGVPSICTAVGGVPDVVGTGAYLIPAADPHALTQALRELVEDPGARARLARRGLQRIATWPTAVQVADLYLSAYQSTDEPAEDTAPRPSALTPDPWSKVIERFDLCPLPHRLELPQNLSVLVIAPHPDDEVLACGGTLALLRRRQCRIQVAVVTDGARGDPLNYSEEDVVVRRANESKAALRILGIEDVRFLGYPDGNFQDSSDSEARLLEIIDELKPDWLLLPSPLDYHRDHVGIALAVLRAWHAAGCRARAFMWELWQPLPATCIVDIGDVFELRQRAAACYSLPHLYCDYSSASAHLLGFRGLYLDGFGQAEAFMEVEPASTWAIMDQLLGLRTYQERLLIRSE